ncbi:MAG: YchJ family protein [Bacteroidales bacterium]
MTYLCPCGSGKPYSECCGAIIEGRMDAPTAESLMRSRYTAFTLSNADYLMTSWHPDTRNMKEKESIRKWSKSVKWIKLDILSVNGGNENDATGYVSFRALFMEDGVMDQILEDSFFERVNGKWVYVSGKHK